MTEDLRSKSATKQATPQCYARLERQFPDISQAWGGLICSELIGGMVGGASDMISMAGDNPRIPL